MEGAGRWSLIRNTEKENEEKNHHQKRREKYPGFFRQDYGAVFRKLLERERLGSGAQVA
jgi:hypothetical protein